ncbi:F-box/LRR-repeat protein 7 isoform X2 [Choloepus didactylus]|uniref:F-box/LRR-repeat protein 7 isoform X2 n=1 Tax=Choloepus didactylus TaxID=27675 RepID=UPI00189C8E6F|nr:F-box/LRR-repeat protein 7 isoform X2 [Choloepus didactylus]
MGANNGKQYGSEGKGSSSISSDVSSSTDHTPTKAQKNVATSEDSDLSMRTLSTPSPALICPPNVPGCQNGRGSSTSSSSVTGETVALVHSPPPTRLTHPLIRLASRPQKEQASIDRLPDHSMIQIFSFLPTNQLCRCARVCRRWYNLAWDPRLWRTIRLTGETIHVDRALKVLTRRLCQDTPNVCLMLETVTVSGCRRLTDRGLYTIAQCCPELRRLEVSGCYNISNEAVFDVVSLCPNLEHLDVSDFHPLPGHDGLLRAGGRGPAHHRRALHPAHPPVPAPLRPPHRRGPPLPDDLLHVHQGAERERLPLRQRLRPARDRQAGVAPAVPQHRPLRPRHRRGHPLHRQVLRQAALPQRAGLRGHHGPRRGVPRQELRQAQVSGHRQVPAGLRHGAGVPGPELL